MQVISAFHTLQTILVELLPVLLVNDILKSHGKWANGAETNEIQSMFVDWDDGDDGVIPKSGRLWDQFANFRVQPHQDQEIPQWCPCQPMQM
jgi:hypothetical protein